MADPLHLRLAQEVAQEITCPTTWQVYADSLAEAGLTFEEEQARLVARELKEVSWLAEQLVAIKKPNLLVNSSNRQHQDRMIATGLLLGYLTDGRIALPMTEEERHRFRKRHGTTTARPFDVSVILQMPRGDRLRLVDFYTDLDELPKVLLRSSGDLELRIQPRYWGLLIRRYTPLARWYATSGTNGPILVTLADKVMAAVMPYQS